MSRLEAFPALERLRGMWKIPFVDLTLRSSRFEEPIGRACLKMYWIDSWALFDVVDGIPPWFGGNPERMKLSCDGGQVARSGGCSISRPSWMP